MTKISLLAVSSRTATLLIVSEGAKYSLPSGCRWTLRSTGNDIVCADVTTKSVVFLAELLPDTTYRFSTPFGELEFSTQSCSGLLDIQDFGAEPACDDNRSAIQAAIDAVPIGGTLKVPAGRYFTGPLFLRSDMTLLLDEGAELAAISDWREWEILPAQDDRGRVIGTWEGLPAESFAALINAIDCSNLKVTGQGIIDGGGDRGDWWSWPKETRRGARRPRTAFFAHCRNVHLSGLTVRNSPSWSVHPFMCLNFNATALKIENPADSPNTDGLNPESCENVSLTGLHFSVGDDCIAVKAGKRDGQTTDHLAPTRNVSISHCLMEFGHGAVVLGSEMSGDITDVTIRNCQFKGTDRGLRIKTRRGRGGKVARIRISDVAMECVDTAISANAFYFCDADGKSEAVQSRCPTTFTESTPVIEDISITNVVAENVRLAAVALLGLPEAPISKIHIENMQVTFDPDAQPGVPLMACDVAVCRHEGIVTEFAEVIGGISILQKEACHAD
jgi:polygalacturonase